ncbi:hypothetical protein QBC34DRAFT_437022 [Podospora aff. communis PSN243]|uniref:Uncharacterized protein n=1 Tax=Podospora aff. communis PSN243 TaxID=3040156 RepID=A0AAV9GRX5_9PEZI|nr:hypothetical protein QBC34DRAFT_437022 [Podospora aff. communis PSN243]
MSEKSTRGYSPPPDRALLDHAAEHRTEDHNYWSWSDWREAHKHRKWKWDKYRVVAAREPPITLDVLGKEPATPTYIDADKITDFLSDKEHSDGQPRVKLAVSFTNGLCTPYSPTLPDETLRKILDAFGVGWLQSYYPSQFVTTLWQGRLSPQDVTQVTAPAVFLCSTGFGAVYPITTIAAYSPKTDSTKSFIISDIGAFDHFALFGAVSEIQRTPHPLLLQVLAVERSLELLMEDLGYINNHTVVEHVKIDKNYADKVAQYRAWWSGWQNRRFMAKQTAEFLLARLENIEQWLPDDRVEQYRDTTELMKTRLNLAVASCVSAEVFGQVISDRLSAWQDAAFRKATQDDNSTMKLLAMLGTVYLPATFVSSFFAMPVFNWQAASVSEMTGQHFWIWWAVMIPLSVMTLATVVLWGRMRAKRGFEWSNGGESV